MKHYRGQIPKSLLLQEKKETEEWAGFTGIDDLKLVEAGFDAHLHQLLLTANNNPYFEKGTNKVSDQNHRFRTLSTVSVKNRDLEANQAAIQAMADSRFYD